MEKCLYDLTGIGTILLALATVGLFVAAVRAGKDALRQYRARWLVELFDRFYTKIEYSEVYLALDDCKPELLRKIEVVVGGATDDKTEWELTRYLNFFEMVLTLVKRKELKEADVLMVFKYPIGRIAKLKEIKKYLEANGYEELAKRC